MGRIPLREGSDDGLREVEEAEPAVLFGLLERITRSAQCRSDGEEDPG